MAGCPGAGFLARLLPVAQAGYYDVVRNLTIMDGA